MSDGFPVYTVAVRGTDGAVFHLDKVPKDMTLWKYLRKLKGITNSDGFNGKQSKWRHIIKAVHAKRESCTVRLIVGWNGDKPLTDEITFRMVERPQLVIPTALAMCEPPSTRKLRGT